MSKNIILTPVFRSEAAILAALKALGFSEVERATNMRIWGGTQRPADLVVRRAHAGCLYGDIGFVRGAVGYQMAMDEIDSRTLMRGEFLDRFSQEYAKAVTVAVMEQYGFHTVSETKVGKQMRIAMCQGW